jgi:hypothetical protein
VVLEPVKLLAIHEHDLPTVKRFKNSQGEQFFSLPNNDKKYYYNEIVPKFSNHQLEFVKDLFGRGFNVSLMLTLPKEQAKSTQLFTEISKWVGEGLYCPLHYGEQQISDLASEARITEKEAERGGKYYSVKEANALVFMDKMLRSQSKLGVTLLKIRKLVHS